MIPFSVTGLQREYDPVLLVEETGEGFGPTGPQWEALGDAQVTHDTDFLKLQLTFKDTCGTGVDRVSKWVL